jgi:hypothetical protein
MKIKIVTVFIMLISVILFLTGNASAGFAANESGISAYVNVGTSINLDQAAGAYKLIEDKTSTYVIGTVEVPNSTEYEIPHVYTSADGWVMAYYPKEQHRSMIMQWAQYDPNNPDLSTMGTTRLEDAISKVVGAVGIDYFTIKPNTKYYDFQHPEANRLTIIAETRATDGADSIKFRIPNDYTLYNVSWVYYSYDSLPPTSGGGTLRGYFRFDGSPLSGTDGQWDHWSYSIASASQQTERYYGTINTMTKEVLHRGDLGFMAYGSDEGSSNIAIFLIYKEP